MPSAVRRAVERAAARRWRGAIGWAALAALAAGWSPAPAAEASAGRFVVLSDLHAYGCDDDGPCPRTAAADCPAGSAVELGCTPSHVDTDGCLFGSFLEDLACTQQGQTDFVLISGDWIAHYYEHGDPSLIPAKKGIMQTLAGALRLQFPGSLIIPAVGNNDAYMGDYNLKPCLAADPADCTSPDGDFLADIQGFWTPLLEGADELGTACLGDPDPGVDHFSESFRRGGYYALSNPHLRDNCTLVLNTVLLLDRYISGGSTSDANGTAAAEAQLAWLEQRLAFARQPTDGSPPRNVWLVYHVPPGADAYASSTHETTAMMYSTSPDHDYASEFVELLAEYRDVVRVSFAGHTHNDSYRILEQGGDGGEETVAFVRVSPSLTPSHHKTEGGYQWFEYHVADGVAVLDDYTTRTVELDAGHSWRAEYSFEGTYCQPCAYDADALGELYRVLSDPTERNHGKAKADYVDYYAEEYHPSDSIGDPPAWTYYRCAIGEIATQGYTECIDAASQGGGG